jgi:hypothetical protein
MQIGNGDQIDGEEQIGPISGDVILAKKLWTINFLMCLIGIAPIDDGTTNKKNPAASPPPACTIS